MASTYSKASVGNGLLAVIAGFASQIMDDLLGDIGPFQLAIAITFVAMLKVYQWPENYGSTHNDKSNGSALKTIGRILSDPMICFVGFGNSLFEGAMYTFGKFVGMSQRIHHNLL